MPMRIHSGIKLAFLLLFLPFSLCATTTVTGTLQNLGTGTVGLGAFVRFWLRGCGGNIPRINGTAVIAPSQGGVYFFDFPAASNGTISGTLYSTRDSTGLLAGDIECGGSKLSVWYGMQIFVGGKGGAEIPLHAKSTVTLDITQAIPINQTPAATAPSGDAVYLRLDGANSPVTGAVTFTGPVTMSGAGTKTINGGNTVFANNSISLQNANMTFGTTASSIGGSTGAFIGGIPTISSGFGTSPSMTATNDSISFTINVGTGGTASSGVINFPVGALSGWNVFCQDITTFSTTVFLTRQTATTANSATVGNFNSSAASAAWASGDVLSCIAVAR